MCRLKKCIFIKSTSRCDLVTIPKRRCASDGSGWCRGSCLQGPEGSHPREAWLCWPWSPAGLAEEVQASQPFPGFVEVLRMCVSSPGHWQPSPALPKRGELTRALREIPGSSCLFQGQPRKLQQVSPLLKERKGGGDNRN